MGGQNGLRALESEGVYSLARLFLDSRNYLPDIYFKVDCFWLASFVYTLLAACPSPWQHILTLEDFPSRVDPKVRSLDLSYKIVIT